MRQLSDLTDVDEPAWPALQEEFANSAAPVEVLPVGNPEQGRACLMQLQVSARSWLGALALHSGGLIVDGGWLRVYGGATSGAHGIPGLAQVNRFPATFDPAWSPADGLIVGHDILGGVFALNGRDPAASGRPGDPGQMLYFAPDSLEWEVLEMGYGTWLTWLLSGRLEVLRRTAVARVAERSSGSGAVPGNLRLPLPLVRGSARGPGSNQQTSRPDDRIARLEQRLLPSVRPERPGVPRIDVGRLPRITLRTGSGRSRGSRARPPSSMRTK